MDTRKPSLGSSPPSPSSCSPRYTARVNPRSLRLPAAAAAIAILLGAAGSLGKPAPVPALPNPSASAAASAAPKVSPIERARRGVVVLERANRPVALGFVLAGDGRMLTSLSPLGDGNGLDARFADGSLVHVRVGHSDRTWDLALLVPQVGRWAEGMAAATGGDPLRLGSQVKTFTQVRSRPVVASVVFKSRSDLIGGDGEVLRDALEVSTRVPGVDLGAPVIDEQGQVVALLSRACSSGADAGACHQVTYGAPVEALRQFLRSAPANAIPPAPWMGIQGIAAANALARGVRVVSVHSESPAAEAGLKGGDEATADLIVAVDGSPVQTPERLAEVVRGRAVGDKVEVIVVRDGKFRVIHVALRASAPPRPAGAGPTTRP